MHDFLLVIRGMAIWFGFGLAFFTVIILVGFFVEPSMKRGRSDFLSMIFWPVLPVLSWFGYEAAARSSGLRTDASKRSGTGGTVKPFRTVREAKDYLAGRIAEQAQREGVPLSEVERQMLYFSETGWTLPNMMEINAEFERDYDDGEYERKIGGLVQNIEARDKAESSHDQDLWDQAVEKLSRGDHYLTVLVTESPSRSARPAGDFKRLILTALACLAGLFLCFFVLERMFGPGWRDKLNHLLK
jgi:hypothetical protein